MLRQIDPNTSFTILSDKDDDAEHKTRLCWIPPKLMNQMQMYADHVQCLTSDSPQCRDWPDPCFFLSKDGSPMSVQPKALGERMGDYLALPPNAHRKFMRLELLKSGCPMEVVNAWLGHAFNGEEPWVPHSSFSFMEYQESLETHLVPLLDELGWSEQMSPLV